jgi:hypothetical protein
MKRKSHLLTWLRYDIYRHARAEIDPDRKSLFMKWHSATKGTETEFDEMLRDAEMHGVRNPAFPDDMIGWLDDDFVDRPQLLGHQFKDKKDDEQQKDKDKQDSENIKSDEQQEGKDDDKKS